MEYTKVTETKIKVTKTAEPVVTENTYDYDFLVAQKARIQEQKDKEVALRDAELAEVDGLLSECDKLGITSEPVEEEIK